MERRTTVRPAVPDGGPRVCQYYRAGTCTLGSNCKYLHFEESQFTEGQTGVYGDRRHPLLQLVVLFASDQRWGSAESRWGAVGKDVWRRLLRLFLMCLTLLRYPDGRASHTRALPPRWLGGPLHCSRIIVGCWPSSHAHKLSAPPAAARSCSLFTLPQSLQLRAQDNPQV